MITSTHRRKAVVALAKSQAAPDGTIPDAAIARLAGDARVARRTIRRWIAEADAVAAQPDAERPAIACTRQRGWVPTERHLAVVAGSFNVAEAHRDLKATDPTIPSYPTFRRALLAVDGGIGAAITRRGGAPALINKRMYLTVTVARRNQRWAMDSQEIPVRVLAPRETEPRKYWQTTAIDEATRMVMATVITKDRPNSADVAACIATGIRGGNAPDGTFVGGVPDQIVWDNAREFLADQITEMALALAFTGTAVTPWAPYEKGKIEAWHKTIQSEFYGKLPGNSHGPRSFANREMWRPEHGNYLTGDLMTVHALLWCERYNVQRPHGSLMGRTPLEQWKSDPSPLRLVAPEALYDAMLVEGRRKVGKAGIRFRNVDYVCAAVNHLVGRTVEIRYMPHDDLHVEVFLDGEHQGTAFAAGRLTPEQRADVMATRRDQYVQARQLLTEAGRLRQVRYEDAIVNGDADLTPLSAHPAVDRRTADPGALIALDGEADPAEDDVAPADHGAVLHDDALDLAGDAALLLSLSDDDGDDLGVAGGAA